MRVLAPMRPLAATLLLVAFAATPAPASTHEPCRVLADPAGDSEGVQDPERPPHAIDLTAVSVKQTERSLAVTMTVVDAHAAPSRASTEMLYVADWSRGRKVFYVRARRHGAQWTFEHGAGSGYLGGVSVSLLSGEATAAPAAGSVSADSITVLFPLRDMGSSADGAAIANLQASTLEWVQDQRGVDGVFALSSEAGTRWDGTQNARHVGRYSLNDGCIPGLELKEPPFTCVVAIDPRSDHWLPGGLLTDDALDVLSLQIGVSDDAVAFDFQVANLRRPESHEGFQWHVAWDAGNTDEDFPFQAWIQHMPDRTTFLYQTPDLRQYSTTGWIDDERDVVRILVPRARLGLRDGIRMRGLAVNTGFAPRGVFVENRDTVPNEWDRSVSFVVGPSCDAQEIPACPVVLDRAGDAGPVLRKGPDIPGNQPPLDIRSTGAEADLETLRAGVRVANLRKGPPAGFDGVGWTVSWRDDRGGRWALQGIRWKNGTKSFRYRRMPSTPLTGPFLGGTRTNGSLDRAEGLVQIEIPRSTLGVGDGEALKGFGATSWAIKRGSTVSFSYVVDSTKQRDYVMGVSCGA